MANSTSMAEGLQRLLSDIAQMMTLPDADLQFLSTLQAGITSYIRQGQQGSQPGQQSAVAGGAGNSPVPPGAGIAGGAPTGGAMMGAGIPNPDELRRLVATQSGGQGG